MSHEAGRPNGLRKISGVVLKAVMTMSTHGVEEDAAARTPRIR